MSQLILTTFDWVPELPRGVVRDIRVRWALEEGGLDYRVESVRFEGRGPEHFAQQPFGQVPWLTDGDMTIFESGAILLHLGEQSPALMPRDAGGRSRVIQWCFAALNSVEMAGLPFALFKFTGDTVASPGRKLFDDFLDTRLRHMEAVLGRGEWLAGAFSIADIQMADVLRVIDRFDGLARFPACRTYVQRATARPAFVKAYADQMAHFAAADRARAKT